MLEDALDLAHKQLAKVGKLHHRTCRVCQTDLYFSKVKERISLISCVCRGSGKREEIRLTPDEFAGLIHRHDHSGFSMV